MCSLPSLEKYERVFASRSEQDCNVCVVLHIVLCIEKTCDGQIRTQGPI
jgi:hypothetical protein